MKKKINILLLCIIFLQCCMCGYFASEKDGYFVDELYSYELANSASEPMMHWEKDFFESWHDAQFFSDYLMVDHDHRFDFGKVYTNQALDVHPPLYYFLLHFVCSFFPGTFSKWYGIGINIFLFCILQVMLFLLGKQIFGNEKHALIPVIIYGFSAGAISNVIYIRMYLLLTLWTVLFVYINFLLWKNDKNYKLYACLCAVTFCGFITQYYFVIFAFFVSACFFLSKILLKAYKAAAVYTIAMFGTLGAAVLYYPAALTHIFSGYRGTEAFANFASSNTLANMKTLARIMNEQLFTQALPIYLILIICCCLLVYFIKNYDFEWNGKTSLFLFAQKDIKKKKYKITYSAICCFVIFAACFGYFVLISKVAPFRVDRYIFSIYPLIVLIFTKLVISLTDYYGKHKTSYLKAIVFVLLAMNIWGCISGNVNYVYPEYKEKTELMEQYGHLDAVYIAKETYRINEDIQLLEHLERTYVTRTDGTEAAIELKAAGADGCIVFITNEYKDCNERVAEFAKKAGFAQSKLMFNNRLSKTYICYN